MRTTLMFLVLALAAPGAEKKHFLLTLTLKQDLKQIPAAGQATLRLHADYLNRLYLNGRLATGGRVEEAARPVGIAVLEVDDEAEARRILEADPAVRAGLMEAKLQPFFLSYPPK